MEIFYHISIAKSTSKNYYHGRNYSKRRAEDVSFIYLIFTDKTYQKRKKHCTARDEGILHRCGQVEQGYKQHKVAYTVYCRIDSAICKSLWGDGKNFALHTYKKHRGDCDGKNFCKHHKACAINTKRNI